jgi:hypothetical protein
MAVFDQYAQEFFAQAPNNHSTPRVPRRTVREPGQVRQSFRVTRRPTWGSRTIRVTSSSFSEEDEDNRGSTFRAPGPASSSSDEHGDNDADPSPSLPDPGDDESEESSINDSNHNVSPPYPVDADQYYQDWR